MGGAAVQGEPRSGPEHRGAAAGGPGEGAGVGVWGTGGRGEGAAGVEPARRGARGMAEDPGSTNGRAAVAVSSQWESGRGGGQPIGALQVEPGPRGAQRGRRLRAGLGARRGSAPCGRSGAAASRPLPCAPRARRSDPRVVPALSHVPGVCVDGAEGSDGADGCCQACMLGWGFCPYSLFFFPKKSL